MQSFHNVSDIKKQNPSHIVQQLNPGNSLALLRKPGFVSASTPRWIKWLLFEHSHFYSIEELLYDYTELEKPDTLTTISQQLNLSSDEEKATLQYALELGKLAIKTAVLNSLPKIDKAHTVTAEDTGTLRTLKKVLYWILFLLGATIATLQGIDGVNSLLQILGFSVSISAWPVVLFSIIGALCACALYYAFELEFLKEKLGLTSNENLQGLLHIHEKQIDTAAKIEKTLLITAEKIHTPEEFGHYVTLCQKFNAQITSINNTTHCYQESTVRKIARYCIMKAGMVLVIGDTLYTVIGVIGGTVISSNPVSIVCCIFLAFGAAAFFIASYTDQIYAKINSTARQMNSTKEKAANYCDNHLLDFLQEKLAAKEKTKESLENNFKLQQKLTAKSQQLVQQQANARKKQQELELWQLWRQAKHSAEKKETKETKKTPLKKRRASLPSNTCSTDKNTLVYKPTYTPGRRNSL